MDISGAFANSACFGLAVALSITLIDATGEKKLCKSQAPRISALTPTGMFDRCTKTLPNGTILTWDSRVQHQKDLASGIALSLK